MAAKFWDSFHVCVYIVVAVLIQNPDHSNAAQYLVGGEDYKWSIPLTNDFYTNWSSAHSFVVGDTLCMFLILQLYSRRLNYFHHFLLHIVSVFCF